MQTERKSELPKVGGCGIEPCRLQKKDEVLFLSLAMHYAAVSNSYLLSLVYVEHEKLKQDFPFTTPRPPHCVHSLSCNEILADNLSQTLIKRAGRFCQL